MKDITVKEIVKAWLIEHKYHGLYDDNSEGCGCTVDALFICGHESWSSDCKPGVKRKCGCSEYDYHIVPKRAKVKGGL